MEPKKDVWSSYAAGMNGIYDGTVANMWARQSQAFDRRQGEKFREEMRAARTLQVPRYEEPRPPPCHAKYSDAGGRIGILVGISLALLSPEYRNAIGMLFLTFVFYVAGWLLGALVYALVQPWVFRMGLAFLVLMAVCTLIAQMPSKPNSGNPENRKWSDTPKDSNPRINRGGFQGKIQY